MESTLGLSVALTSLLLYFLPVIIAFVRGHESRWGDFPYDVVFRLDYAVLVFQPCMGSFC